MQALWLSTNKLANKWTSGTAKYYKLLSTKYHKLLSTDNFSRLATSLPGLLEDQWRDFPRLRGARHRPHHLDPGRVPHRGLQAISTARILTAYQVFSAANSVIPEIGAINDWDNVAIVMKFSSGTLAQVKYCLRIGVQEDIFVFHYQNLRLG